MKRMLLGMLLLLLLIPACSGGATTTSSLLPRAMKGYELYSWQEGGAWHFTLITGTNRAKNAEEITSGGSTVAEDGWVNIQVTGQEALLDVLRRVPAGTWLVWQGRPTCGETDGLDFHLPPQNVVDAVLAQVQAQGATMYPPSTGLPPAS